MRIRWLLLAVVGVVLAACAPGTPDLGFAPKGAIPYGTIGNGADGVRSLVPLPDGSVAATKGVRALTRISGTGQVDPNWGASLPTDCDHSGGAQSAGSRILFLCGRVSTAGRTEWQVWRVTTGGQLDPGFGGGDGIVDLPEEMVAASVAALPGGGVLALGHDELPPSRTSVPPLVTLVLSPTGHVVSSGTVPITVTPLPDQVDGYRLGTGLVATPTGALAIESLTTTVIGTSTDLGQYRTQHFSAEGAALDDPPFGGPSLGTVQFGGLAQLSDGRLVQASTTTTIDVEFHSVAVSSSLVATAADGSPDAGFGNGGTVSLEIPGVGRLQPAGVLATNGEGFLVVAGTDPTGKPRIARFNATTGALDPNFGNGGSIGVLLTNLDAVAPRTGADQLYLAGNDAQGRSVVTRVWNHVTG